MPHARTETAHVPAFVKTVEDELVQVPTVEDLAERDEARAARGRFWIGTLTTTVVGGIVALAAFGASLNAENHDNHQGHINDSVAVMEIRQTVSQSLDESNKQLRHANRAADAIAKKLGVPVEP